MDNFNTNNSEFVGSKKYISNGNQVTYEPTKHQTASIEVNTEYLNSDELSKLTNLLNEFEKLIDENTSDISFAVGCIVLDDDKPIKIKRIIK